MSASVLYTPEVLALSTGLSQYPWDADLPLSGEARSQSCGSTIVLGLAMTSDGRIERVGLRSQACAIGQAAASIFAAAAPGKDGRTVADAESAIAAWLSGETDIPDWPGLEAIAAARAYPGRHGAILLPWRAARELLCTATTPR